MFDVFYNGRAPGLFAHERPAQDLAHAAELSRTRFFWWVSDFFDYRNFDFTYIPPPWQEHFVHVWPTQWEQVLGAYLVPTNNPSAGYHYHDQSIPPILYPDRFKQLVDCEFDFNWSPHPWDPPYIYVFGNQWHRSEIMPTVEYHVPGATEKKYLGYPCARLLPDPSRWTIPSGISDVDLSWVPDPGSPPYIYQFGTQWQKTGGAVYTVPGATEVKYVEQIKTTTKKVAQRAYLIDHMNVVPSELTDQFENKIEIVKTVRFFDNYLDTLKRIANSAEDEAIWIVSSICDYTKFDFTWHPELWQGHMLHVFPSNDQKFGDTFFMHVPTFRDRIDQFEILDWYDLNFCTDQTVPRQSWPVVTYSGPSMVPVLNDYDFKTTYALFCHESHESTHAVHTASVWSKKHRELVAFSAGNSTALVPKDVKQHLKEQVYDYPYIKQSGVRLYEQPQDIVFISYDELNADENYQSLQARFPHARRVHGIEGMVNALVHAAEQSTTDWYYAVFAKTEVHEDFAFDFTPDRFQQPKHYIFHAINVVNDLVYGEMGIILYNKQMVLQGPKHLGIDYTMSFPNETIPIVSAWGRFNTNPYQTWRTAFRETAKLCLFDHQRPTVENSYRLNTWLTRAQGDHAEWALRGAADGKQFFEECQGIEEQMKPMFSWQWLRERFENTYGKNL